MLAASDVDELRRTIVIGTSCTGKTAFAVELAARLQCPHVELDHLYWLPEWQARPLQEFRSLVENAVSKETWVMDGNYGKVRDLTWPRASAVVWLDYAFPLVFGRALKRSISRIFTGERLFAGNRETFRRTFLSRESILLWVLKTYHRRRREYPQLLHDPQHCHLVVHRLQSPSLASTFLSALP